MSDDVVGHFAAHAELYEPYQHGKLTQNFNSLMVISYLDYFSKKNLIHSYGLQTAIGSPARSKGINNELLINTIMHDTFLVQGKLSNSSTIKIYLFYRGKK